MSRTKPRKYVPMGAAEVFSAKTHALYFGQWPIELQLAEVWVSAATEHRNSPWRVLAKRTRSVPAGEPLERVFEWVATTDMVSMQLAEVVRRSGYPAVMQDVLLRRYVLAEESEQERGIELMPMDEIRVRVSRGLLDTRKGPHQLYAVFGVVVNEG